jgi:hypothetical protein
MVAGTTAADNDSQAVGSGGFEATEAGDTDSGAGSGSLSVQSTGTGDGLVDGNSSASANAAGGGQGGDNTFSMSEGMQINGFNTAGMSSFNSVSTSGTRTPNLFGRDRVRPIRNRNPNRGGNL